MLYVYLLGLLTVAALFVGVISRPTGPARMVLPRAAPPAQGIAPAFHLAQPGRRRRALRRP